MRLMWLCLVVGLTAPACWAKDPAGFELVGVEKVWDQGKHNAFTGLTRHDGKWYCVFREAKTHAVSPDGAIRVLTSTDGKTWESAALLRSTTADLRDPKITVAADGRLMIVAAGALNDTKAGITHQSLIWYSRDGRDWGESIPVGDPNFWLWRVTWHKGAAYGVGYSAKKPYAAKLYRSTDGKKFTPLVEKFVTEGYPNETGMTFLPDGTALCLIRFDPRDGGPSNGRLGTAKPPYTEWTWKDVGAKIGGPDLIRLPDGLLITVVRLYDKKVRTSVCTVDAKTGAVAEVLPLPSGGDTSYAGLVWHDGLLWVSYYSTHEGKSSIYLAKVRPPKSH